MRVLFFMDLKSILYTYGYKIKCKLFMHEPLCFYLLITTFSHSKM
jgi:hypothetical protein